MAAHSSYFQNDSGSVVVLGASGRLGSMVSRYWPQKPALVRHSTSRKPGFMTFDLLNPPKGTHKELQGAQAVICFSGITDKRTHDTGQSLSRNTDLALSALHLAHRAGAGRVFLASSAAVYGAAGGLLKEHDECMPVSAYGKAKLEMEKTILDQAQKIEHPVTALRIGNVAGADAILGGWRPDMRIDELPDGTTPRRSYIGPATLTAVLYSLSLAKDLPMVLNLASPGSVEMGALLDAANLNWQRRQPATPVICDVTLCTKALSQHVDLASTSGTAEVLIDEWHNWRSGDGT